MISYVCIIEQAGRHTSSGATYFGFWSMYQLQMLGFCSKSQAGQGITHTLNLHWSWLNYCVMTSLLENTTRHKHHPNFLLQALTDTISSVLREEASNAVFVQRMELQHQKATRRKRALNAITVMLVYAVGNVLLHTTLLYSQKNSKIIVYDVSYLSYLFVALLIFKFFLVF